MSDLGRVREALLRFRFSGIAIVVEAADGIEALPLDVTVHASRLDAYREWQRAIGRTAISEVEGEK